MSVDADRAGTNLSVQHYHGSIYPSNPTRRTQKDPGIVSEGVHESKSLKSHENQSKHYLRSQAPSRRCDDRTGYPAVISTINLHRRTFHARDIQEARSCSILQLSSRRLRLFDRPGKRILVHRRNLFRSCPIELARRFHRQCTQEKGEGETGAA
jgi:hypothetical protein